MKKIYIIILSFCSLLFACKNGESDKDATGVFESTEVIVSAETTGRLLEFETFEGMEVNKEKVLGQIDTVQLSLKKMQLQANQLALEASKPDVSAQISATEREVEKLEFERKRTQRLLEGDVATQKQLDDIEAQIDVLKARLRAQKKSLNSSTDAINAQYNAVNVQIDQLSDQISRCQIRSPIQGTILVKYAEAGEFVNMGKPLFKVANMKQMILKAYVTAAQLTDVQLGQRLTVLAEIGAEQTKTYEGEVTWISSKSEFTPKTIQTQDERANLVYAIKVQVENDGLLKIGMYAGLKWTTE
ncbi:HlyD family secretion protein [Lutimonas sp.]|uniref:HlyD family secretion protein n=1 Tax=Lutimonas sp. TaxID=1872403 RepID=UPI003D9B9A74